MSSSKPTITDTALVPPIFATKAGELRAVLDQHGYILRHKIGKGGFGSVYLAEDTTLQRRVAVKFLDGSNRPGKQLREEMKTTAALKHPNIVIVHQVYVDGAHPFAVMEYIDSDRTLRDRLRQGQMQPVEAVELLVPIAEAVGHVNRQGILHRDLKPANILLDAQDQPKVADFGLAVSDDEQLRRTELAGTEPYLAPEQIHNNRNPLNAKDLQRCDIHALGVILYEMLRGKRPFAATARDELFDKIERLVPDAPQGDGIDEELQQICMKCLEKEPSNRFQSALELAERLRSWLEPKETIRISTAHTLTAPADLNTHVGVACLAFSPDGRLIATGAEKKGAVQFWTSSLQGSYWHESDGPVSSVAFSCDGKWFASSSGIYIKLFKVAEDRLMRQYSFNQNRTIWSLSFSPNGRFLAAGDRYGRVKFWDVQKGGQDRPVTFGDCEFEPAVPDDEVDAQDSLPTRREAVNSVAFVNDELLVVASKEGAIYMVDVERRDYALCNESHCNSPRLCFSQSTGMLACGGTADGSNRLKLFSLEKGGFVEHKFRGLRVDSVSSVAFSPNGVLMAFGSGKTVQIWNALTREHVKSVDANSRIRCVAFRPPTADAVVAGCADGIVEIFSI